ncbi:MAG: T9SS type A sorting domain-containing protein [Ferruginibacter sp.]
MQKTIALFISCCIAMYSNCQASFSKDSVSPTLPMLQQKSITKNISKPGLSIYPNPANGKITLQVKNFDAGMVSVKLLDTKGKLVKEDERLLTKGTEDIIMFLMLKAGIYFIVISEPGKIARKKLVIL